MKFFFGILMIRNIVRPGNFTNPTQNIGRWQMNYYALRIMLTVIFVLCAVTARTQDMRENDHEELRTLLVEVTDAFNKRDTAALAACLTKEFVFTTLDQQVLTSAGEIDDYYKKIFDSPDAFITDAKISPEASILTRFTDANSGYCYGINHEVYTMKDGRTVPMETHWTATVVKEEGRWKIAAAHAGVNFLDNPVIERSKKVAKKLSVIGFITGLITMLVIVVLVKKIKCKNN